MGSQNETNRYLLTISFAYTFAIPFFIYPFSAFTSEFVMQHLNHHCFHKVYICDVYKSQKARVYVTYPRPKGLQKPPPFGLELFCNIDIKYKGKNPFCDLTLSALIGLVFF